MDNWRDKIFAFIKGPGWFPGTPKLGDPTGVPEIQHRPKYDPQVAGWVNVYAGIKELFKTFAMCNSTNYVN